MASKPFCSRARRCPSSRARVTSELERGRGWCALREGAVMGSHWACSLARGGGRSLGKEMAVEHEHERWTTLYPSRAGLVILFEICVQCGALRCMLQA